MRDVARALADPARYRRALERLRGRPARRLDVVDRDGVTLRHLLLDVPAVARRIAATVARRALVPAPAQVRRVRLDKERELFRFAPADEVVHGVLAELLTELLEPRLSPCLWSYRRGRSSFQAVAALAGFVRAHVRARPDVRARGLHVLHADVRRYGESIRLDAGSPLWADLRALLGTLDVPALALVEKLVRPEVDLGGAAATPIVGLATGSPIATVLTNLYLAPVDGALDAIPGAFYARYGDDLFFAHPERAVVERAGAALTAILGERGLAIQPAKRLFCFWNRAGRPSADGITGTTHVTFLGCRVGFDGTVGLPSAKLRELLGDLRPRIRRASRLAAGLAAGERAGVVARVVAQALDSRSSLATALAPWLTSVVTDRRQLAEIDHLVALEVASAVTGRSGPRAFRALPYRRLRREHGLPSLVVRRNRGAGA
jgi:Reverse transcriptase (RNA-dependent DNA polymerase)